MEHAHKGSMEFINEGDMEELFKKLYDGKVHYALCSRGENVSNLIPLRCALIKSILGNNWCCGCPLQRPLNIPCATCLGIW